MQRRRRDERLEATSDPARVEVHLCLRSHSFSLRFAIWRFAFSPSGAPVQAIGISYERLVKLENAESRKTREPIIGGVSDASDVMRSETLWGTSFGGSRDARGLNCFDERDPEPESLGEEVRCAKSLTGTSFTGDACGWSRC